jgi:hypothetical protein
MNKKQLSNKWILNNGACGFDFKNKNIILHDGGIFSIETEKMKVSKYVRTKRMSDGNIQFIFSKKKKTIDIYKAIIYINELDETINYFKRMKKMLNKLGCITGRRK